MTWSVFIHIGRVHDIPPLILIAVAPGARFLFSSTLCQLTPPRLQPSTLAAGLLI